MCVVLMLLFDAGLRNSFVSTRQQHQYPFVASCVRDAGEATCSATWFAVDDFLVFASFSDFTSTEDANDQTRIQLWRQPGNIMAT